MATPVQLLLLSSPAAGKLIPLPRSCGYVKVEISNLTTDHNAWIGFRNSNNGDSLTVPSVVPAPAAGATYDGLQFVPVGGSVEYDWLKYRTGDVDSLGTRMTHVIVFTTLASVISVYGN